MEEKKRGRGRPVTGNAKTPTERVQASEAAILADGGQRLGTVRIGAEASLALEVLIARYGSKKAAVEAALIAHAKIIVGTNDK
ncbi:hypothetical protein HA052_04170 [Chromobacterium haemolyticum]|uniref:Uncharacterized protein n=1 Tax=Chromobacterium fluminis TaxID=3044269 RepID=A0ABX0L4B1_9NEIS|nr:hypothetical protein [Chromobacterium haemolyticum]NHR04386.1 hypothetical protein [Chromobacterium haemolyticum]